ncbi:uncharacterized protein [Triticum aestivum]|uniref:uncharacterized protein n=1 Tax=Triticum aestivum TaxID=4565 RepID=UPI001D0334C1|nr:uncharacterized protein LOC123064966 [Triticum aestivum]
MPASTAPVSIHFRQDLASPRCSQRASASSSPPPMTGYFDPTIGPPWIRPTTRRWPRIRPRGPTQMPAASTTRPTPPPPPFHQADVVAVLRVDHGLLSDRLLVTLVVLLLLQRSSSFLADGNSNDVIFFLRPPQPLTNTATCSSGLKSCILYIGVKFDLPEKEALPRPMLAVRAWKSPCILFENLGACQKRSEISMTEV